MELRRKISRWWTWDEKWRRRVITFGVQLRNLTHEVPLFTVKRIVLPEKRRQVSCTAHVSNSDFKKTLAWALGQKIDCRQKCTHKALGNKRFKASPRGFFPMWESADEEARVSLTISYSRIAVKCERGESRKMGKSNYNRWLFNEKQTNIEMPSCIDLLLCQFKKNFFYEAILSF